MTHHIYPQGSLGSINCTAIDEHGHLVAHSYLIGAEILCDGDPEFYAEVLRSNAAKKFTGLNDNLVLCGNSEITKITRAPCTYKGNPTSRLAIATKQWNISVPEFSVADCRTSATVEAAIVEYLNPSHYRTNDDEDKVTITLSTDPLIFYGPNSQYSLSANELTPLEIIELKEASLAGRLLWVGVMDKDGYLLEAKSLDIAEAYNRTLLVNKSYFDIQSGPKVDTLNSGEIWLKPNLPQNFLLMDNPSIYELANVMRKQFCKKNETLFISNGLTKGILING